MTYLQIILADKIACILLSWFPLGKNLGKISWQGILWSLCRPRMWSGTVAIEVRPPASSIHDATGLFMQPDGAGGVDFMNIREGCEEGNGIQLYRALEEIDFLDLLPSGFRLGTGCEWHAGKMIFVRT